MSGGELVVERNPGELRVGVREDGRVVEVILDRRGAASRVGAIHLARVLRIEAGLGAFVDLGAGKPAFLPATADPPVEGAAILVQVVKDDVTGKGPEVTRAVVLDGGPLALTPTQPGISVSRKLPEGLRRRLRERAKAMAGSDDPSPGLLVRSAALEDVDGLERVWRDLSDVWRQLAGRLGETPPLLLRPPEDAVGRLVRMVRPARAVAGDAALAARLRSLVDRVEKIDRPFERLGIDDELARVLAREIAIPGGSLIVEEGETLTAIDVNGTGDRMALCLAAAREVAHLLRLRRLGGTVVVDLPLVGGRERRVRIDAAMKAAVAGDPQPVECLGWTRAGLYEMTRPRLGPSLAAQLLETPAARTSVETAALAALRALARADGGRLRLVAAPEVIAWLEGDGAAALAEAARPIALVADAGYGRERFDVTPE